MSLLLYFLILVACISFCVVAFLLISAGDLTAFRNMYESKPKSFLPVISRYGDVLSTPHDIDYKLTNLKAKLKEKYQELDNYKNKMTCRLESLQRMENYRKICLEMQAELIRIEEEANDLQNKVEYFRRLQLRIQEDLVPSTGYMGDADWIREHQSRVVM